MICACGFNPVSTWAQSLTNAVELYQWVDFPVEAPEAATGIAKWDANGSCEWTHEDGVTRRTSLVWYSGKKDTYVYRFGASLQGNWTCTTRSPFSALDGLNLRVEVLPSGNSNRAN